jgi:hypothetical protein
MALPGFLKCNPLPVEFLQLNFFNNREPVPRGVKEKPACGAGFFFSGESSPHERFPAGLIWVSWLADHPTLCAFPSPT